MRYPFTFDPTSFIQSASILDIVVYIGTILVYLCDFKMPPLVARYLTSAVGLAVILFTSAYMLLYTKPITGIIFVFLAYRIIQMSQTFIPYSTATTLQTSAYRQPFSSRSEPIVMPQYSVAVERTLEEAMVAKYAPIGVHKPITVDDDTVASYKPVYSTASYSGVPV